MSEAEKTRGSPHVPPYSSPDPPPPGLPSAQQLAPPQQTLAVQTQPPHPTGPQYYTQLAYPAVSGAGSSVKGGLVTDTLTTLPLPSHYTATGGPDTTTAAHCGHTAGSHTA